MTRDYQPQLAWERFCRPYMFTDFENYSVFKPDPRHEKSVTAVFEQVIAWGGALKTLREKQA